MAPQKDILPAKWPEIKGQVQQKWSKLTEEDIANLNGKAEDLARVLRLRYRYGWSEANLEICNWLRHLEIEP